MASLICWNCGENLDDVPRPISRHATCPQCFSELHCCRMCRRFDPNVTGQCEDERTDPPVYKDNANFCEHFSPLAGAYESVRGQRRDSARDKLDELFGAADSEDGCDGTDEHQAAPAKSAEELARAKLDALFKDNSG